MKLKRYITADGRELVDTEEVAEALAAPPPHRVGAGTVRRRTGDGIEWERVPVDLVPRSD